MAGNRVLLSLSEENFDNLIDCILIAEECFAEQGMVEEIRELEALRLRLVVTAEY